MMCSSDGGMTWTDFMQGLPDDADFMAYVLRRAQRISMQRHLMEYMFIMMMLDNGRHLIIYYHGYGY